MRKLTAFVALLACSGCATTSKDLNRLSIGMTKAQVIQVLGEPRSTSADVEGETMHYSLAEHSVASLSDPYFVLLKGGKVVQYGRTPRKAGGASCVTTMVSGSAITDCR